MCSIENFSNLKEIGTGAFARVFRAVHTTTFSPVAMKFIQNEELKEAQTRICFNNEVRLHRSLDHPFVLHYFGKAHDSNNEIIIIEIVDGESLLQHVNTTKGLSEERARMIFVQLISALKYLHHKNILHRDVKLENILIEGDVIRLIDFGLSKETAENNSKCITQCGSYPYAAPEVLSGTPYTASIDVWSAGIVLYSMVAGRLPFEGRSFHETARKILHSAPYYPQRFSPELVDLLTRIFEKDPKKRITIDEMAEHPFLAESKYRLFLTDEFARKLDLEIMSDPIDAMTLKMLENYGRDPNKIANAIINNEDNEHTMDYRIFRMTLIKKRTSDIFNQLSSKQNSKLLMNPFNNVLSTFASKFKCAGSALAKEGMGVKLPPPRQSSAAMPKGLNQFRMRRREQETFTYSPLMASALSYRED